MEKRLQRKQDVLKDMTNVPHFILPLLSRQLGDGEGVVCLDANNGSPLVTIGTQTLEYQQEEGHEEQEPANQNLATLYHGAWPTFDKGNAVGNMGPGVAAFPDTASVMSFNSAHTSSTQANAARTTSNHQLGTKVEMVYSLLSMLGTHDKDDMSRTLLAMSSSQDSCIAMRQSGCLPLLVQLLHGSDKDSVLGNTRGRKTARARAAAALHNIVHSHPDDKRGRREARVLRLLEQIRAHCDQLRDSPDEDEDAENQDSNKKATGHGSADIDHHPGPAIAALMKLSFDEEHRHAICTLGGLQAIAELLQLDHDANGNTSEQYNITMRRYACMALTNLTFGDGTNKALLCSMKTCMKALVAQLQSSNEDLRQVAASVLRNLSWRADLASKKTLREVGAVVALMKASMEVSKESTLKSILSALWNLSAHCSENKADICAVDESLAFLVSTLTYKSPSKTLAIIENGGGILRNISSHIAIREEYRKVLREHGCLQILLKHLRSPSLTIVSNACGTLWNLSARCPEDQRALWELGAVNMLRNLVHSKHKMISMGSAAALKNLLAAKPSMMTLDGDKHKQSNMPTLHVRKQRALEAELDQTLAETCDNVESPSGSPTEQRKHIPVDASKNFVFGNDNNAYQSGEPDHRRSFVRNQFARNPSADAAFMLEAKMRSPSRPVSRSGSQDSVGSVHSDISHDRVRTHNVLAKSNRLLTERQNMNSDRRMGDRRAGPNSRIVQVMQEVAIHAGIDGNYMRESHSAENTPPTMRRSQTNPTLRDAANLPPRINNYMKNGQQFSPRHSIAGDTHLAQRLGQQQPTQQQQQQQTQQSPNEGQIPYQNITQCMESLHLDDDSSQEQPINYSLKYADGPNQAKQANNVGNFMHELMYNGQSQVPAQNAQSMKSPPHKANSQYSEFSEQDNDAMDQPTNYSIRFAEQVDDGHFSDQPINYSTRFQESGANEDEEADNTVIHQEQDEMNLDTIRTFCTEGTPYLSTATSMEDLTGIGKEDKPKTPQTKANPESKQYPSHFTESHSSKSTEHQTSSTVVRGKQTESAANIQNNNVSRVVDTVPQPSLYSYNDNVTASPGSEKPMQYCTEGTPTCFSRVSSLSSLHSTDAHDHPDNNQNRGDLTLQSIDENHSLETTNRQTGGTPMRPDSHNRSLNATNGSIGSGTNTPSHHKSVTFDENNQVQETPLMFSRCSSLGSLSSFDAHSVHSSVVSDYSRRASEVVSPSELPDSPSDSMPGSPSRKSPVKFDSKLNDSQSTNITQIRKPVVQQQPPPPANISAAGEESNVQIVRPIPTKTLFADSPKQFGDEGTPDFSCATSLSGLDLDEPDICRDSELERIPLGPEEGEEEAPSSGEPSQLEFTVIEKTENAAESDNDSVSEGDEDILNEYMMMAMPKRKAKKSSSQSQVAAADVPRSPYIKVPSGYVNLDIEDPMDTIKQYGTEDTPLNYSRDDALSNLSFNSSTGELVNLGGLGERESPTNDDDDKSDISSIADDGEDCEDLLSEAIAAAMPKKVAKASKSDNRTAKGQMERPKEGALVKEKHQQQNMRQHSQQQVYPQRGSLSVAARAVSHSVPPQSDCIRTYCEEGTPINFSRATSLSELSQLDPDGASQDHSVGSELDESDQFDEIPTAYFDGDTSLPVEIMDSPTSFGMEGTPLSFSRNDSLSSLSCDEDAELENAKQHLKGAKLPLHSKGSPKSLLTPKQRLLGRLKSPGSGSKNRSPGSRAQRNLAFGKPQPQSPLAMSPPRSEYDQIQMFAVEGTPHCFSRNSSLSSLNSTDNDISANVSDIKGDEDAQQACSSGDTSAEQEHIEGQLPPDSFYVEDTPANFSRNSSLSSLSVESLGFEPSEAALLEECINAAMPKTKSAKKKVSKIPRNCPTSTPKDKFVKPRTPPSGNQPKVKTPSPSREGSPKNVQSSQHGNEVERTRVEEQNTSEHPQLTIENVVWRHRSPSQELEGSPKLLKDASNQEKVLGALMMESEDKNSEEKDDSQVKGLVFDFDNKLYISESDLDNKNDVEDYNNKLVDMELANSDMIASAIFREASEIAEGFAEAAQLEDESCSESDYPIVAKEEIEATKENPVVEGDEQLGCFPIDCSFHDITKETFPDMGLSLGSSMMSSVGDDNQVTVRSKSSTGASVRNVSNETDLSLDEGVGHDDSNDTAIEDDDSKRFSDVTEGSDTNSHEITLEEEQALEENAELLIRELSNVHLSQLSSSVNSEMFIENETISLVSNDTDTCSEVSVSLSCSSKAMSEKTNEDSNASSSAASRPRILKPGERSSLEVKAKEEEVKAVRGKRKPLTSRVNSGRPPSVSSPMKNDTKSKKTTPPTKPNTVKSKPPVGNTKVIPKTPSKVTPAAKSNVTPAAKAAPKMKPLAGKPTAGVKPTPKASAVVAPMTKNTNATRAAARKPSPARSGTASPRNQSPADKMRNKTTTKEPSSLASTNVKKPQSKVTSALIKGKAKNSGKVNNNEADRPKPPIKQGTFTKDSPTQNAPEIEGDDNEDIKDDSPSSNRSSAELKYSNDTQEKAPGEKISPRSSKADAAGPSSTPPAVANLKQNGSQKAVAGKSNSTGNLTKTTKSVTKTASGSNLTKTGSNTSLTKGSGTFKVPKAPLKKGDSMSNQSLKKDSSKPGTSVTTPKKGTGNDKTGGRATVPVASKIASLWRKGDSKTASPSKAGPEKKTPLKKEKEKTPAAKSETKPKFLRRSLASSQPSKGAKEDGKQSKTPNKKDDKGMQRSSTYDKLPVNEGEAESAEKAETSSGGSPAKNNVWRRTYTIENEEEVLQAVTTDDCETSNSPGVWMRRDNDRTPVKSQIPAPVRSSPEQSGDGRGNKPSPPSAFPNKSGLGISPPGAKPTVTSPNAAIVAPFNYVPTQSLNNKPVSSANDENDLKGMKPNNGTDSPTRPMTKTEMLIARRRQSYLNSVNKSGEEQKTSEEDESKRTACLVTTV
uniref:Adenomatous polyposis coli n=1 Tax=Platynereis dumerilii TaxID=6359 RepID=A0A1B1M0P9_PLADU|nr:adenomatous polyposis coli [Platynereis dumerilii]